MKKVQKRRVFKLLLIVTITLLVTVIGIKTVKNYMKTERIEKGIFRFEDYKNANDAKAVLIKLHPVGSPVNNLLNTLIQSGATVEKIKGYDSEEIYFYTYNSNAFMGPYKWSGGIRYDSNKNILGLGVGTQL